MSSFSKLLAFLVIVNVTSAGDVFSQTPDTLDPKGYMPLEVGNTWEYLHAITRPVTIYRPEDESRLQFERYAILDEANRNDTLFYSLLYDVRNSDRTPLYRDTLLIRYDSLTASIVGEELPQIFEWLRCLDASFGANESLNGFCWAFTLPDEQAYPELTFSNEPIPIKRFESFVWAFRAGHGIGIMEGGGGCEPCDAFSDSDYWYLKYAYVGGETYGAQIVSIDSYKRSKQTSYSVFPNPADTEVFVQVSRGGRIELYDLLGRQVGEKVAREPGMERIDLQDYRPGLYVIRMGGETQTLIVR